MSDALGMITMDQLPPELRALIEKFNGEVGMRSPVRKPLTDLREPADPKKRLHRPSFFFEYGPDVGPYRHQEYPKVKWHENGTDTLVLSRAAEEVLGPEWGDSPHNAPADAVGQVRDDLMALTPEEKTLVMDAYREARISAIRRKLEGLTEAELDAVLGETRPARRTKKSKKGV